MKKLLAILLFFATVLPAVGQTDKNSPTESYLSDNHKEKKTNNAFNNQFEFDVEFLALTCGYNHRIYKNWFLGYNLGLGFGIGIRELPEIAHFSITIQYKTTIFTYEISPTVVAYSNLNFDTPQGGSASGLIFGVFYGKKVQIGIRIFVGITLTTTNDNVEFLGERGNLFITPNLISVKFPIRW